MFLHITYASRDILDEPEGTKKNLSSICRTRYHIDTVTLTGR